MAIAGLVLAFAIVAAAAAADNGVTSDSDSSDSLTRDSDRNGANLDTVTVVATGVSNMDAASAGDVTREQLQGQPLRRVEQGAPPRGAAGVKKQNQLEVEYLDSL